MLEKSNILSKQDLDTINNHLAKIMPIFDRYWSIDFTKGTDGTWYLIDMARGELSYHYEGVNFVRPEKFLNKTIDIIVE